MKKLIEMELMLAGWRETHHGGFIVQLLVKPEDDAFFRQHTALKGKVAGQLYQTYWMPFDDDAEAKPGAHTKPTVLVSPPIEPTFPSDKDAIATPEHTALWEEANAKAAAVAADLAGHAMGEPKKKAKFPGGLCGLAVRWGSDEHFLAWLPSEFPDEWLPDFVPDEAAAKAFVCTLCGITSRKELNTDELAAGVFVSKIKEPYQLQREEDGVDEDFDDGNPF